MNSNIPKVVALKFSEENGTQSNVLYCPEGFTEFVQKDLRFKAPDTQNQLTVTGYISGRDGKSYVSLESLEIYLTITKLNIESGSAQELADYLSDILTRKNLGLP